jgi:molybdenum cofactor cytidylyltransferase
LAAVILSAGESSRMGSPKALVPFRGRTFLGHLLEVIRASKDEPVAQKPVAQSSSSRVENSRTDQRIGVTRVVLGAGAEEIRARLGLDPASVVINADWRSGQLSSIQAAIRSLSPAAVGAEPGEDADGVMLFLVDHPLVSSQLVSALIRRFYESGKAIVLPTFQGHRGHPVIFARRLFAELLAADLTKGAREVVWAHADDVLETPTEEEGVVMNLNDPEALRRAKERFEGGAT